MIMCPNFSDQNVLREFNELKSVVGEIGAYHIWNENNGNPIDQTKDGKPSKLFSDLLQYYNGDRQAAIKGRAKTFTNTFKQWFGDWSSMTTETTLNHNQSVDFIFDINPEISKIGTKQEYAQYLETIFPNTQVKDIYWHGSDTNLFDGLTGKKGKGSGAPETGNEMYFNKQPWASLQYISGVNRNVADIEGYNNWVKLWWELKEALGNGRMDTDDWKNEIIGPNTRQYSPNKRGVFNRDKGGPNGKYLSERKARYGYQNKSDQQFFEEVFDIRYGKETFNDWVNRKKGEFKKLWDGRSVKHGIFPAILNVSNPIKETGQNTYYEEQRGLFTAAKKNNNDAILSDSAKNEFSSDVAVVFNPEKNVHILGTYDDLQLFSQWKQKYGNQSVSKAVDINGEPIITEFNGDMVFVSDPEYDSTKELTELDPIKIKSVNNTGSFSTSDSRLQGSQLDESLQFYLSKSLDNRYKQDVQEFIEAYNVYFNKYDYATQEELQKRLEGIIQNIHDGLKNRLKTINKKDTNVTDEFKAALVLQISELENKTIDRVTSIFHFINNTKQDAISTVKKIRDIANGKSDKLPLKQLLDLKQDFFSFYCPMIDDCVSTLTSVEEYRNLIGATTYDKMLSDAKNIQTLLNTGANNVDNWIVEQSADELRKVGISVNSPTIESYLQDNKDKVSKDILTITAWIGAGDKISDEAIRALFHITQQAEYEIDRATYSVSNKLLDLLNKVGTYNQRKLVELDENGKPTGYMVRRRNYGKFNNEYKQFLKELRDRLGIVDVEDFRTIDPAIRSEYNKSKNEWLSLHCERKYKPEYYELFNNLSPLAADARELVQIKIHKLLDTVKDKNGYYDTSKLSPSNQKKLSSLYLEKKQLASIYDIHGVLKTGEEYDIALELSNLNEKLSKGMMLKSNKELFDRVKAEKKASLSEAEYQRWLKYNSRDEYTQEFYDDLAKIEKSEITNPKDAELYEELQNRKRAILRQFRDDKTHEIESLIPNAAQNELDKIDIDLSKIRRRNGRKKTQGLKFNDIAKVVPTQLFYQLRSEAIENGTLGVFEQQHCNRDANGVIYPKSYLTKIVPVKEKYILKEQPSMYFSEVDPQSPFINENYKPYEEDGGEYYLPKDNMYDNTKAFEEIQNDANLLALYKECVNVMQESNSKLTNLTNLNKYRLPQISGSMWRYVKARGYEGFKEYWKDKVSVKNDDTGMNEDIVEVSEDKLHFVPQNFVKSLEDPATITANTVGSIIQYFKMAENFRVKSELKPKTEAILQFIGNRDVKSKIRGKSKKGKESNLYKFAKSFVEMNIYDIKTKSATVDIKERDVDIFGFKMHIQPRKVNFTKVMLGLKAIGTTVNLGLNLICAFTGFITATMAHLVNSFTGRYYDFYDMCSAVKSLNVDTFKNITNIFSPYTKSKQMKLMEYFQVGSELSTSNLNQIAIQSQLARNWAFGIYSVSDYFVKGAILNSVMYNFKYVNGEFLNKEEFKNKYKDDEVMLRQWRSFRSAYDLVEYKDYTIKAKDQKHQKAWEAKRDVIGSTARNLAQSADGQLTPLQKTMLSSNIIGSLLMMHRQFMPIILQERWVQNRQWDYGSQRYKEALFRVPFSIINAMRKDNRNIKLYQKYMQNSTPDQRKAILQLGIEMTMLAGLHWALLPIIKSWADDDKDSIIRQLIAFALIRTDFETLMNVTPWAVSDAINTIKTPFPIYSYYDNFTSLISIIPETTYNIISNKKSDKIDRGAYEDWAKAQKYGLKLTPFKNLWELQDIPSKRRYYETQIANRDN